MQDSKSENVQVRLEEIILEGKYNPALFIPANRALDSFSTELIQKGLEANDTRKYIQRDLLDVKSSRCSEMFRDRNRKASELKFVQVDTCSYCDKKYDASKLHVYLFLAFAGTKDPIVEEIKKRADPKTKDSSVLKNIVGWSLETKIRDVRSADPLTINGGSFLFCLSRCEECMKSAKIELVD